MIEFYVNRERSSYHMTKIPILFLDITVFFT